MKYLGRDLVATVEEIDFSDSYFLYDFSFNLIYVEAEPNDENTETFELAIRKHNNYTLYYPISILYGDTHDKVIVEYPHDDTKKVFTTYRDVYSADPCLYDWFVDLLFFDSMIPHNYGKPIKSYT